MIPASVVRQAADGSCTGAVVDLTAASMYHIAINDFMAVGGDGYPNVGARAHSREIMDQTVADWITANARWVLDIVLKRPGQTTFEVQKWRWVVERTFGWFGRYRRLSKDYEHNPKSSEAWIYIAMIHRMSRLSMPERNKDDDLMRRPPKLLKC